jgi:hypothetical protein
MGYGVGWDRLRVL